MYEVVASTVKEWDIVKVEQTARNNSLSTPDDERLSVVQ